MSEIKIGDYIRVNRIDREICKIEDIDECLKAYWLDNCYYDELVEENSYLINFKEAKKCKYSSNIIDLIEIGDYINGSKVVNKNGDLGELVLREDTGFLYINKGNNISKIESIVTHEQFKRMEYKV